MAASIAARLRSLFGQKAPGDQSGHVTLADVEHRPHTRLTIRQRTRALQQCTHNE